MTARENLRALAAEAQKMGLYELVGHCQNTRIKQTDSARNLWDVTYACGAVEQVDMRASNHAIPENDRAHNRRCAARPAPSEPPTGRYEPTAETPSA